MPGFASSLQSYLKSRFGKGEMTGKILVWWKKNPAMGKGKRLEKIPAWWDISLRGREKVLRCMEPLVLRHPPHRLGFSLSFCISVTYLSIRSVFPNGSGHISQGRVVWGTHCPLKASTIGTYRPRDKLYKGRIVQGTEHPRLFVRGHISRERHHIALIIVSLNNNKSWGNRTYIDLQ